jgi:hypothetical protein
LSIGGIKPADYCWIVLVVAVVVVVVVVVVV